MALTTTSILNPQIQQSWDNRLLAIRVPNMIHNLAADYRRMPRNGGKTLRMSRYDRLGTAMVPLGNTGVTPPSQTPNRVDIDANINFYGTWVGLEEQVTLQTQDGALNSVVKLLGISLRETEDQLTKEMLEASASLIRCTGGSNGDSPTEVTLSDVQTVELALRDADARIIESSVEATDKIGTAPTMNSFYMFSHTQMSKPFYNLRNFIKKNQYPSPKSHPSEIGSIEGFRVFTSSIGSYNTGASANGATVYNNFGCGLESYAVIRQDGYTTKFIYLDPRFSGPLAQYGTVGFKMAYASANLNDLWLVNMAATLAT